MYRNNRVEAAIARQLGVPESAAHLLFQQLLSYLHDNAAAARPSSPPSADVDTAWHIFMLHTRDYSAYCDEHFGGYVHHDPPPDPRPTPARTGGASCSTLRSSN